VPSDLQAYLDQQEREILVKALRETDFNRTAAAQRLGLSLRQIRYRIARLAIATPGSEEPDDSRRLSRPTRSGARAGTASRAAAIAQLRPAARGARST
jgi:hypothetical protein